MAGQASTPKVAESALAVPAQRPEMSPQRSGVCSGQECLRWRWTKKRRPAGHRPLPMPMTATLVHNQECAAGFPPAGWASGRYPGQKRKGGCVQPAPSATLDGWGAEPSSREEMHARVAANVRSALPPGERGCALAILTSHGARRLDVVSNAAPHPCR